MLVLGILTHHQSILSHPYFIYNYFFENEYFYAKNDTFCTNPSIKVEYLRSAFYKVKETVLRLPLLEKVFLLMGCSKNYIMYWGVFTFIIIPRSTEKVCTILNKF